MVKATCCIFDMDGLLIDTERIYTEAAQEFLSRHKPGAVYTWELKSQLMGRTAVDSNTLFLKAMDIDMPVEQCTAELLALQHDLYETCVPLPGVERLLRYLHRNKIPMAVATSSTRYKMALKIKRHTELFALFGRHVTCGDDVEVKKGKPAPDIFLCAREKLGINEEGEKVELPELKSCLVFEDALLGVQAAHAAEMNAIWVPDPNLRALEKPSTFVEPLDTLNSLADFDPTKYGLPAWDD